MHVIASVSGKGCGIVSTVAIPVPNLASKPHSVVLTTRGGDEATVVVDGRAAVRVDMKTKCPACTFTPVFAVGGTSGGIGAKGISEPDALGSTASSRP